MSMHPESEGDNVRYVKWLRKKAALLEEIQHCEHPLDEEKALCDDAENGSPPASKRVLLAEDKHPQQHGLLFLDIQG
jgi:hypothetical protein